MKPLRFSDWEAEKTFPLFSLLWLSFCVILGSIDQEEFSRISAASNLETDELHRLRPEKRKRLSAVSTMHSTETEVKILIISNASAFGVCMSWNVYHLHFQLHLSFRSEKENCEPHVLCSPSRAFFFSRREHILRTHPCWFFSSLFRLVFFAFGRKTVKISAREENE